MEKKLLEGVKVIDFGQIATVPLTTKYFADCGAVVVKIEGKTRMDGIRNTTPFKDGIVGVNRSARFGQWNTSKLSVALNLTHPKAVEVAKRLVAWGDVVTDNFAAGVMERLGLGYEDLRKVKPNIIMFSSCLQGHTGPAAQNRGAGNILQALTGFSHITGWPDRDPADLGVYTDFINPHFHAFIVVAALDHRRRTGQGMYLDMSQQECCLQFLAPSLLDYAVNRREANRMGNRSTYVAPHAAYRCRGEDRWCAIAVFTDEEWQSFCQVIGNPAWSNNPKFATFFLRKENEDELDRLVEEWTITHPPEEVMTMMQSAGVPAGVVETGEDLIEYNPQLKHRHFFWELEHPEMERYIAHRSPFVPSKTHYEMRRAPLLAEHNEYALKEFLAMSDEEIAELVRDGSLE